jgi:hypothetical protein
MVALLSPLAGCARAQEDWTWGREQAARAIMETDWAWDAQFNTEKADIVAEPMTLNVWVKETYRPDSIELIDYLYQQLVAVDDYRPTARFLIVWWSANPTHYGFSSTVDLTVPENLLREKYGASADTRLVTVYEELYAAGDKNPPNPPDKILEFHEGDPMPIFY